MPYVVIEGLDGSGKSTLLENMIMRLSSSQIQYSLCKPTKPVQKDATLEKMFNSFPYARENWLLKSFLYADRSRKASIRTNWNSPLVLGDRSVITSYVVYRHRFQSKMLAKCWVDLLEASIPGPDFVLYLNLGFDALWKRKLSRGVKLDIDEKGDRPKQMLEAYNELKEKAWKVKRLCNTHWIDIDASVSIKDVALQAWSELDRILSHKR